MNRRTFVGMAAASSIALAARFGRGESAKPAGGKDQGRGDDLQTRWQKLDSTIRGWWDGDLRHADEAAIRNDAEKTLLFLPCPYCSGGGSEAAFPGLYGWDTQFVNLALLVHGRTDIVRWHILDQLSMIDRFGMVLNGNRTYYLTRSQPPLLAWSVENYLAVKDDEELALQAYASLRREYASYWNGPDHATPTGLSTCRDAACKDLRQELAAAAEAGVDFTPIFDGDVRHCVPINVNAALVYQAKVLSSLAVRFGWSKEAARWHQEADLRGQRINQYCWDESKGFYFEYDYVRKKSLPFYSLNGFWPLWAGIASKGQASRVVEQLRLFDQPFGLAFTDRQYPSPHPEFAFNQWAYPEAWPPEQILVALALRRYDFRDEMCRISLRYIRNVVETYERTGLLWERYNAVAGGHEVPIEREAPAPLHGFTSASAVMVGRSAFGLELEPPPARRSNGAGGQAGASAPGRQ
jgi:alpha,alpha-trehalase